MSWQFGESNLFRTNCGNWTARTLFNQKIMTWIARFNLHLKNLFVDYGYTYVWIYHCMIANSLSFDYGTFLVTSHDLSLLFTRTWSKTILSFRARFKRASFYIQFTFPDYLTNLNLTWDFFESLIVSHPRLFLRRQHHSNYPLIEYILFSKGHVNGYICQHSRQLGWLDNISKDVVLSIKGFPF